jgi:hypothetical protein
MGDARELGLVQARGEEGSYAGHNPTYFRMIYRARAGSRATPICQQCAEGGFSQKNDRERHPVGVGLKRIVGAYSSFVKH